MATRTKILVVDNNLHTLSRVYLALLHRNYKVEATDQLQELKDRIKRMKPAVLILNKTDYLNVMNELKIPAVVLVNKEENSGLPAEGELMILENPVQIDKLVEAIEHLVY